MSHRAVCAILATWLAGCGGTGPDLTAIGQKGKGKSGDREREAPEQPPLPRAHAELLVLPFVDNEATVAALAELAGALQTEPVGTTGYHLFVLPGDADVEAVLDALEDDPRVDRAEFNFIGEAPEGGPSTPTVLGGDVLLSVGKQSAFAEFDLPGAHAISTGAGQLVAVVDTGIDPTHPLLADRIAPDGFDFVDGDADPTDSQSGLDDDGDGLVDEQFGHGTFVASLVLAVAPDARILPVRVLDSEGRGTTARVAAGITWAVDRGASVINLSLDVNGDARVIKAAVEYAELHDVLVVAGAGNSAAEQIGFPASYGDVVGVGATAPNGQVANFSSLGPRLSLVAPGTDLVGAYPFSRTPFGTARWSGTSFSAPLVAGTAALVRARFPAMGWNDVETRLNDTARPLDLTDRDLLDLTGHGMVQPAAAVR